MIAQLMAPERTPSPSSALAAASSSTPTTSAVRAPSTQAVIRAHREGILTTASLMVNEPACDEAVALASENPKLGVGLHLTLLCGRSALPPEKIPGLVNARGEFSDNPVGAGFRYFFHAACGSNCGAEIHAQFERFRATGLPLDHVNGHLHLHLHPTVFRILMEDAEQLGIRHLRLTREPFWMDVPLARGRRLYRAAHAAIHFCSLVARASRAFAANESATRNASLACCRTIAWMKPTF